MTDAYDDEGRLLHSHEETETETSERIGVGAWPAGTAFAGTSSWGQARTPDGICGLAWVGSAAEEARKVVLGIVDGGALDCLSCGC